MRLRLFWLTTIQVEILLPVLLYGEFVKGNGQISNELNNQVNSHLTTYPSDHYKLPIIHRGNYVNTVYHQDT